MSDPQTLPAVDTVPQVGNPLLSQIHEFIGSDEEQQPTLDPVGIVLRALRGREVPTFAAAFVVAALFGLLAWMVVAPAYQSLGMIRVLPREANILYTNPDDSGIGIEDVRLTG